MKENQPSNTSLSKFLPLIPLIIALGFGGLHFNWGKIDCTDDSRYSLSPKTKSFVAKIPKTTQVTLFLAGNFPAEMDRFQNEIKYSLSQISQIQNKVEFQIINPIKAGLSQSQMASKGMSAQVFPEYEDGKVSETVFYPYIEIKSGEKRQVISVLENGNFATPADQMSASQESLEYKVVSALYDVQQKSKPAIAVIVNHDELGIQEFTTFMRALSGKYSPYPIIPRNNTTLSLEDWPKMQQASLLIMAKPRLKVQDSEKIILDQFLMHGGKALYMIDPVNAEMDSLKRSPKITAFPQEHGMEDLLFAYGVRIQPNLVKDLIQYAKINIVAGEVGGNPQMMKLPWPYFPLGISDGENPITKNLSPVKFEFSGSIEVLKRKNIQPKILYQSSEKTLVKTLPSFIDLNEIASVDSIAMREKPSEPKILALSLEGNFTSAYAGRSEASSFPDFKANSTRNKMVVIADADLARNKVYKGKPLPLGTEVGSDDRYGNEEFLLNTVDWLLSQEQFSDLKKKSLASRLLDQNKITESKSSIYFWLIGFPTILFIIFGLFSMYWKKRKYSV